MNCLLKLLEHDEDNVSPSNTFPYSSVTSQIWNHHFEELDNKLHSFITPQICVIFWSTG